MTSEQNEIVIHLDSIRNKIDNLILKAQLEIDSMKEYKKSLITDIVTGQKAVPM